MAEELYQKTNQIYFMHGDIRMVRYSFPRSRQSRRDLPRDNPLDSVESLGMMKKKEKNENMGRVRIETERVLEQTQQGSCYEVSVSTEGVEELKRIE